MDRNQRSNFQILTLQNPHINCRLQSLRVYADIMEAKQMRVRGSHLGESLRSAADSDEFA
jgi:hypothetical protein